MRYSSTKDKPWASKPEYFSSPKKHGKDRYTPNKSFWRYARRRHWLNKYMAAKSCEYCAYNDPRALQWDHIDPTQKLGKVSEFQTLVSTTKMFNEIRKCRILCSNCHDIRTYEDGQHGKCDNLSQRQLDFERYHNE